MILLASKCILPFGPTYTTLNSIRYEADCHILALAQKYSFTAILGSLFEVLANGRFLGVIMSGGDL
jgi:hypothetical protein